MNPVDHWLPKTVQIVVENLMFFKYGIYVLLGLKGFSMLMRAIRGDS